MLIIDNNKVYLKNKKEKVFDDVEILGYYKETKNSYLLKDLNSKLKYAIRKTDKFFAKASYLDKKIYYQYTLEKPFNISIDGIIKNLKVA